MEQQDELRIMVFGGTGKGKSSVINMLAGEQIAKVSDSAKGATFDTVPYKGVRDTTTSIPERANQAFTLIDTAGLNETESGTVTASQAVFKLKDLLVDSTQNGISLAIMVHRGRMEDVSFESNHEVFVKAFLQGIPVVLMLTGHEHLRDWKSEWLTNAENAAVIERYGFTGKVLGGCALYGGDLEQYIKPKREETRRQLWELIHQHKLPENRLFLGNWPNVWIKMWNSACKWVGEWAARIADDSSWKDQIMRVGAIIPAELSKLQEVLLRIGLTMQEAKKFLLDVTTAAS